jgi:hypothetical protein
VHGVQGVGSCALCQLHLQQSVVAEVIARNSTHWTNEVIKVTLGTFGLFSGIIHVCLQ